MESADRNAKDLQKTQHPQAVNALKHQSPFSAPPTSTKTFECFRYGGAHFATSCHFKDSECRLCKKKGHIARVYRSKKAPEPGKAPPTQRNVVLAALFEIHLCFFDENAVVPWQIIDNLDINGTIEGKIFAVRCCVVFVGLCFFQHYWHYLK